MSDLPALHVAIDGPAASGKTTVARLLARRLDVLCLDTGAMYRALAYLALETQTEADNEAALCRLLVAGDREIDEARLQSNAVNAIVSTVAAHPRVREMMVARQRAVAARGAVVMAGRDIGTVVLPDAPVKVFLTASVDARVERRREQLAHAGVDVAAHRLREEIEERDRLDRSRAVAPLVPARDAHVIDSSEMTPDDVVNEIVALVTAARAAT